MTNPTLPIGIRRKRRFVSFAAGIACCLSASSLRAATPAEVDQAIGKAQAYIRAQENKDGNWDSEPHTELHGPVPIWGGYTALATYALSAAGENPSAPTLARAVKFLEKEDIKLTYAVGLRCQVALYLHDDVDVKKMVYKDFQTLLKGADKSGRYGYDAGDPTRPDDNRHNSTSQYGVLGMWACEQLGQEVPLSYWKKVEDGWEACQGGDGGWGYQSVKPGGVGEPATPAFTAAGLASLYITQEYLHQGSECNGNIDNPHIDLAAKWLGDHFGAIAGGYPWYGIERIGVAGGYKYLGGHNWYQEGAERIVRGQKADGSWEGGLPEVCFNLVFLVRGRAPVMLNKLRYNVTDGGKVQLGHWNQRPRDCFNYVNWMDHQLETRLNWQIVDLANGGADLNDAPVLFIAGNETLTFTPEEQASLRNFVQQGGLIVGNADCNNPAFKESFQKLGNQLFPMYEFRPLNPDHVIFTNQQFTKSKIKPNVLGLSNGVRELMLLPDDDLSRAFEGSNTVTRAEQYRLLDNIILYTLAKTGLEEKGVTYLVRDNSAAPTERTVKLARLEYSGNWDPEPYGWKQFAAVVHNQNKIGLSVEAVKLGDGALVGHKSGETGPPPPTAQQLREQAVKQLPPDQVLGAAADPAKLEALIQDKIRQIQAAGSSLGPVLPYRIAHLTGTAPFTLSEPQRQELREFLDRGGTLLVDAAGGSPNFTVSAEKELGMVLGTQLSSQLDRPLPVNHPVFNQPGGKIETITWRRYAREKSVVHPSNPRIFGLERNGRIAVFYSREDLSMGLVGAPVDGIIGYDPSTATALVRNILTYAIGAQ